MKYLLKPVIYLKNTDFDNKGHLINPNIPKDIPVVIMIQANFCHFCTISKPDFQKFSEGGNGKYISATIQGDSEDSKLSDKISTICPNFQGFPSYVVYKNGKYLRDYTGERDSESLTKFVNTL